MDKLHNQKTVETASIPANFMSSTQNGATNLRDAATCDFLNRGLSSKLFCLVVCYGKMRVPIRYLTPIENGWIECIIADDTGDSDDDARFVIKNYTNFLLTFGKGVELARNLL